MTRLLRVRRARRRYKFEINSSDGNGFAKHIREDHNMWIYLCVPPPRIQTTRASDVSAPPAPWRVGVSRTMLTQGLAWVARVAREGATATL